jgi:16S rRNA (guanine527-N7)-methyltransferase
MERWSAPVSNILRAVGPTVPEGAIEAAAEPVARWLASLTRWNERIDLTAARSDAELVDLMVADAAMFAGEIAPGASVVDVGAGAGAPGLPLALLRPDLRVTLIEPMQKRVALLRLAVGQAGLAGRVTVERARGEEVTSRFDVAISRATLAPPAWLALGASLADEVWVLLAHGDPPSLSGWALVRDRAYRWPLTDVARRALCFRSSRGPV